MNGISATVAICVLAAAFLFGIFTALSTIADGERHERKKPELKLTAYGMDPVELNRIHWKKQLKAIGEDFAEDKPCQKQ